jgi:hypothetical protein
MKEIIYTYILHIYLHMNICVFLHYSCYIYLRMYAYFINAYT